MGKVLLIDNYDSFTYNLCHYLEGIAGEPVRVVRNDEIDVKSLKEYDKIVISPGPGLPKNAGNLMGLFHHITPSHRVLGICLGQQAIAEFFGMKLLNLGKVVHGQKSKIQITDPTEVLFQGLPKQFEVGRYHSWVIDPDSLNEDLRVTSVTSEGEIMSISHNFLPYKAVQFHPESILTQYGKELLINWYRDC